MAPIGVLLLSLAMTGAVWIFSIVEHDHATERRFASVADELVAEFDRSLGTAAREAVSVAGFVTDDVAPGAGTGVALALRVPHGDLSRHMSRQRASMPSYQVWPPAERPFHYPVIRADADDPTSRHGHDLADDPARLDAIDRAIRTRQPAFTGILAPPATASDSAAMPEPRVVVIAAVPRSAAVDAEALGVVAISLPLARLGNAMVAGTPGIALAVTTRTTGADAVTVDTHPGKARSRRIAPRVHTLHQGGTDFEVRIGALPGFGDSPGGMDLRIPLVGILLTLGLYALVEWLSRREAAVRVQQAEELALSRERSRLQSRISMALVAGAPFDEVVTIALRGAESFVPGAQASWFTVDEAGNRRERVHGRASGDGEPQADVGTDLAAAPEYLDRLRRNQLVVVSDALNDPVVTAMRECIRASGVGAFVDVPVHQGGGLRGSLRIDLDAPATWASERLRVLREIGDAVAIALEFSQARATRDAAFAQEAASRSFLDAVLDALPHPVFVKDTQHRILKVNREGARWHGLTKEEVEGRTDSELIGETAAHALRTRRTRRRWHPPASCSVLSSRGDCRMRPPRCSSARRPWISAAACTSSACRCPSTICGRPSVVPKRANDSSR